MDTIGGWAGSVGTSIGFSMRGGGNDTQGYVIFLTAPACAASSALAAALCVISGVSAVETLQGCGVVCFLGLIAAAQHVKLM